ncbi:MAG: hypothetical protein ACI31M_03855 [Bacilli bacterium]
MKKSIKYVIFTIFTYMFLSVTVLAQNANLGLECDQGVVDVFKIGGYALFIVKILVPLLLMIVACVDMFKAVIGNDQDLVKKQTQVIMKRAIASIVIFLLPSIIYFAFTVLVNFDSDLEKYDNLGMCLREPDSCSIASTCPSE